jgi:hypothetical protein
MHLLICSIFTISQWCTTASLNAAQVLHEREGGWNRLDDKDSTHAPPCGGMRQIPRGQHITDIPD